MDQHSVKADAMPYRPCAGIVLLNQQCNIWIGRRCTDMVSDENRYRWQMPQGGIDEGEDPRTAALRELREETGVRSAEIAGESDWILYDLPPEAIGRALRGKYRGQRQKWFAAHFTGEEAEIDLFGHAGQQEFDAWRWAEPAEVLELIVPFKRAAYEQVMRTFAHLFVPG